MNHKGSTMRVVTGLIWLQWD